MTNLEVNNFNNSAIYERRRSAITLAYDLDDELCLENFCDEVYDVLNRYEISEDSSINVVQDLLSVDDNIPMCNIVDVGIDCSFISEATLNGALLEIERIRSA